MNKLLISHASADRHIVAPFIELLKAIGISDDLLIYTSYDNTGIPLKKDFSKHLKESFNENTLHVVFMLSDNFYTRIMCLNEMGAAWVKDCVYDFVFLPNFDPSNEKFNQGALNPRTQGFHYDNKARLIEFIQGVTSEFHITRIANIEDSIESYMIALQEVHKKSNALSTVQIFKRPF